MIAETPNDGRYCLIILRGRHRKEIYKDSPQALANVLYSEITSHWSVRSLGESVRQEGRILSWSEGVAEPTCAVAWGLSPHGRALDLLELARSVVNARKCKRLPLFSFGRARNFWTGIGPVPGTGCHHRYRHYRRFRTQQERRLNLPSGEELEPIVRGARRGGNLPCYWDDLHRIIERNWKSQHKGRKAWDR